MRPRDVIAFVNQCLSVSENEYEVNAGKIRQAEIEYSRIRRESLEQEWLSAFPSVRKILEFISASKRESFNIAEILDESKIDNLVVDLIGKDQSQFDPLIKHALRYYETGRRNPIELMREMLSILYRVGAIGLKVRTSGRFSYSHLDEPVISPATIPDEVRVRIHPMLHSALKLRFGDAA